MSRRERRASAGTIARLESQLMALQAEVVGAFEREHDWSGYGYPSAATAVREIARVPAQQARRSVALARALRGMPRTAAALAEGTLTTAHAMRLRVAAKRHTFSDGEALLVEQASILRWSDWLEVVGYWEACADDAESSDPGEPAGSDAREARARFHATRGFDGMGDLEGRLDPIGFEAFSEALHRIEHELFDDEWRATRARLGDAAVPDDMPRTPAQRRAAALVEMAHRAMTAPADGKRPLPLVVIHTDPDTFNRELARVVGVEAPSPLGTTRLHELASGTVIDPSAMLRAALHGEVRRLVYTSPSHVLDYGRSVRLFQGALRQAIIHAARRCAADGCEIPASRCEIDHVVEWNAGGTTAASNATPRCRADHRHKSARSRARPVPG
ncbi:MAG: DUF222 domain-containing protein [Actinomycetota bacterium]